MRRDVLMTMAESHMKEAGNDPKSWRDGFHAQMDKIIKEHKVNLHEVSVKELFEALVDYNRSVDIESSQAVAESMYAAGYPALVGKLLHPIFMESYTPQTQDVMKLVRETTSKKGKETIGGLSAHDSPQLTREGSPYQSSQPTEKEAEIRNHKFGITVDLTIEAVTEDTTGQIISKAMDIGLKGGTQIHAFIIQKVCDIDCTVTGEAAGNSLFMAGAARTMFADTHTWDNGLTNDNSGADALGATGLKNGRLALAKMKDEKGEKVYIKPRFLIVPENLWDVAKALMGSALVVSGNTAAAPNMNVWQNAYELVSSPFLDDVTTQAWWLGDPTMQTRLQWYWKPRTESTPASTQEAFTRDIVAQFKFSYKAGCGSTDYRYLYRGQAL